MPDEDFVRIADLASGAAGKGAEMVATGRTAAAQVTSVHGKLRHTVILGEDYAATAAGLQLAVNEAQIIRLPEDASTTILAAPVEIKPYTTLIGAGETRSRLSATGALAFVYEAPNGTAVLQGPKFSDFLLTCAHSGIKLNDAAGGFTDDGTTQCYISGVRLDRVIIYGATVAGSIGIELNKVFHAVIDQSEIAGFETGYSGLGCDFETIRGRTRIWLCGTLIQTGKITTFGSGMRVIGADLLYPSHRFIRSSNNDLKVQGCYLEKSVADPPTPPNLPLTGAIFDIEHGYMTDISGNRIEVPAAAGPVLLKVEGEGVLFVFAENATGGEAWGTTDWNGDNSALYFRNIVRRQQIIVRDNCPAVPAPFSSRGPAISYREPWVLTPSTPGLRSDDYGTTCRIVDGAFVLPPLASFGSLVSLFDADNPITGAVTVHTLAFATVDGQDLGVQRLNGATPVASATPALTLSPAWYTVFTGVTVTDLRLKLWNDDVATGGDAHILAVVVERA